MYAPLLGKLTRWIVSALAVIGLLGCMFGAVGFVVGLLMLCAKQPQAGALIWGGLIALVAGAISAVLAEIYEVLAAIQGRLELFRPLQPPTEGPPG